MADFRMKLFTLAGVATVFAGMAFGQVNCTDAVVTAAAGTPTANAVFVRAEGKTEQVADMTFKCDTGTALAGASTMTVTVYLSPAVAITSKTVGSGGAAKNEATASTSVNGGAPVVTQGTVSANSVTFTVATPATVGGTMAVTITNIKIDATALPASSGVPTSLTETIFVGGTGAVPAVLGTTPAVAFVTAGIGSIKTTGTGANAICNALTSAAANFSIGFSEGFGNSFKLQGGVGNAALNSWFINNTETGFYFLNGAAGDNTATSATRVKIVLNNLPANLAVYMPITVPATAPSTGVMVMTTSETGAFTAATASTATGAPAASAALTVGSGSATVIYEYRGIGGTVGATGPNDATLESYSVGVFLVGAAGAVPAPAGAITATVSFAPIGAASNVPNFVSGASTATVSGSTFTACTTSMLFPFVTNSLGFDTGLAIANTSTDQLGLTTKATVVSSASPGAGVCTLTFFGSNAPANPVVTPSVASGTTYAATVSSLAPGFTGYAIAQCNFLLAHSFAYISYNLTQTSGVSMGYLALEIPLGAAAGSSTTTTITRTASSAAPETLGN